jgi:hypothetical protein
LKSKIQEKLGKRSHGSGQFKTVDLGPHAALSDVLWLHKVWEKKYWPALQQNRQELALRGEKIL